jgi:squamous cell carcinoma antigen recognized by T-cells 3
MRKMDINSLLSPSDSVQVTPQPQRPSPKPVQSPGKQIRKNASGTTKRGATSSPLARSAIPPSTIPQHVNSPAHRPAVSSPLVSPTAGVLSNPSPPRSHEPKRQSSTPSMDTLADLASMQNHQPARSAAPSLRSKDSFESQLSPSTMYPMAQPTSATSNPRASFDIAMAETPKPAARSDFTGTSLSPEWQQKASTLASTLQKNPNAYETHANLVRLLHQAFVDHVYPPSSPDFHGDPHTFDLLQDLRSARENMDKMFAIGEDLWADWIQDESMLAKTVDEKISVMEKCSKAVTEDYGSVKLWVVFGEWLLHTHRLYHESTEDGSVGLSEEDKVVGRDIFSWSVVLDTWQNGAEDTMWRMNDSHLVWNRYIELLLQDLRQNGSDDQISQVKSLFDARLQTPHADWDGTFQLFSTFISTYMNSGYEEIMVATNRNATDAKSKWEARQTMETAIRQDQEAGDQAAEYTAFAEYVQWERTPGKKKPLSFDLTNALYQRAELRFPSDPKLWEDHALYLVEEGHANRTTQSTLPTLDRATRHCPWSGSLWAQYILSSERQGQSFSQVEDIKHKATNTGLLDVGGMEEMTKVLVAWCTYLRRRAFQAESTDEELDVAEMGIRSSIENLQELAGKKFGEGSIPDPMYRLDRIYIKFLSETGSWDTARETYRSMIPEQQDSWEFWYRFYLWEMCCWVKFIHMEQGEDGKISRKTPIPHYATAILRQALQRVETMDWPERIMYQYIIHCEDHEDVEELQMAIVEVKKMEKVIAQRRAAEALEVTKMAQAEAVGSAPRVEESVPDVVEMDVHIGKRKRVVEDESNTNSNKKNKSEDSFRNASDQAAKTEKQIKRDRENATILVQNLSDNVTETKLRQFFRDCGTINSLKVIHQDGTTAVIEFDEKEAAIFAQTRDGKIFEGQPIEVQIGSGSTIFVANFPPTADEAYIRDLFDKYGEIIDVRFPSLKYNTHRRFAYVQFKLNAQAQAATERDGEPVEGDLKLIAKISNPTVKQDRSGAMEEGREVYAKNIHWSASEEDVKNLFSKYGAVESVRIPRNAVGKSKGFCFIVFSTEVCIFPSIRDIWLTLLRMKQTQLLPSMDIHSCQDHFMSKYQAREEPNDKLPQSSQWLTDQSRLRQGPTVLQHLPEPCPQLHRMRSILQEIDTPVQ